ncbi:MAG: alpha-ribazole phosphatase [Nitrospirota bacterium]
MVPTNEKRKKMFEEMGKPTRIYLIRHGEVVNHHEGRYNGFNDVDITEEGVKQMRSVAERLNGAKVSAIYCSDLIRAYRGAKIINNGRSLPIIKKTELRERNIGVWENLTLEEIMKSYKDEWNRFLNDVVDFRPDGGESMKEVDARVNKELTKIVEDHKGDEILMVAHGGVNRTILCRALGLDLKYLFRIEQRYGALNIIDYYDDIAIVNLMNG